LLDRNGTQRSGPATAEALGNISTSVMPFVSTQTSWGSYFVVEMLVVTPEIQTPSCTKGGTRYRRSFAIVASLIDVSKAGAWLPFFRAHSGKATPKREPYLFPEDVQNVIRNAIQQRYKHLPVWYTLFHEYIVYKTPLIRPLFFHYTNDRNVFETQNQILVGKFWTRRNGKKIKICL
jgi:hypothetical protein